LESLENGTLSHTPQNHALATKCCMLKKEHGKLNFLQSTKQVHDRVRGVNPWPGAFAVLEDGAVLKIWKTKASSDRGIYAATGTCLGDAKRGLFVQCSDGLLEILELQAPGGKRMDAKTFLRGKSLDGQVLS